MPKCVYCKQDYHNPRGLTLVMKDGTINHLCSSKCRKNMTMKRRKVRWILKDKKEKAAPVEEVPKKEEVVETPVEEKSETAEVREDARREKGVEEKKEEVKEGREKAEEKKE
ncbi:hypothetical protein KAR91_36425 [Candidatus Pacearchaeota archaeon]|nr:hypothetical protein [Candidatus Pacearchaeota archaeon]